MDIFKGSPSSENSQNISTIVDIQGPILTADEIEKEMEELNNSSEGGEVSDPQIGDDNLKNVFHDMPSTPPIQVKTPPRRSERLKSHGHDYIMSMRAKESDFEEDPKTLKKALTCHDRE